MISSNLYEAAFGIKVGAIRWGAARHKLNTDGMADCCKRSGKEANLYTGGY